MLKGNNVTAIIIVLYLYWQDIMIFSASKHCGLAGTRFGWGLFKDATLADQVDDVKYGTIVAVSEDSMLRTYNTISHVLGKHAAITTAIIYLELI